MWQREHTEESSASLDRLWERIATPAHWSEQSMNVAWAEIHGPFEVGTKLTMKPKGMRGPSRAFGLTLVEVTPQRSYTTRAKLPLGHLDLGHFLEPIDDSKVRLRFRVSITGPLTWMFARVIGRQMAKDMPEGMRNIIRFAEAPAPS